MSDEPVLDDNPMSRAQAARRTAARFAADTLSSHVRPSRLDRSVDLGGPSRSR